MNTVRLAATGLFNIVFVQENREFFHTQLKMEVEVHQTARGTPNHQGPGERVRILSVNSFEP